MIGWGVISFFLVLAGKLFIDYRKFLRREPVNHKKEWLVCAALSIPSVVLLVVGHPAYSGVSWPTFWITICVVLLEMVLFWFLFDGIYNVLRGQKWNFLGSFNDPGHEDSDLDKVAQIMGAELSQFIKIVGSAVLIIVYVLSLIKNIQP
ncbi:MAG: hypothetical protein ABIT05_01465 [Chitinophagaceae bacterium]